MSFDIDALEKFVMDTIDHTWGKTNQYSLEGVKALIRYRFDFYRGLEPKARNENG